VAGRLLVGVGVLVLAACLESTGPAPPPVASVTLTPPAATVLVGGTVQWTAKVRDAAGSEVTGRPVTWASSDTTVATVSATGLVTGVARGSATITATSEAQSATGWITVGAISLAVLSAGSRHACGIATTGAAYCWGYNFAGELGNGTTTNSLVPTAVLGGLSFVDVNAGASGTGLVSPPAPTCGVVTSGQAYCWGANNNGSLGNGLTTGRETRPVAVVGGLTFTTVSAGESHTCAVTAAGAAYCWGSNWSGELGNGTTTGSPTPVAVVGGLSFAAVSSGANHTCGVTTSGGAYCWGANWSGQLGNGQLRQSATPVAVAGGLSFAALSASADYTCGLTVGGSVYCWGSAEFGQLGNGATTYSSAPVVVTGGLSFTTVTAGMAHSCGVTTSGAAYCWGGNFDGQLGNGSNTSSPAPVPVTGGLSFASLTAGDRYTCGLTSDGLAYCWGFNGYGRLGNGTTTSSPVPVKVAGTAPTTVNPPAPVASVTVIPAASTLVVGETVQLMAIARDAAGNALIGRTVRWTSSDTLVATVSGSGLVRSATPGSATITATSEGRSGTAAVTVNPPAPVASVTIAPASATVVVGGTVPLTATTKDAAGNVLTGRAVAWTSSDAAVATVSGTGLVTGVAAGSATIMATSEGQSGTAQLSVRVISFVLLSTGDGHTCGITTTGAAYCWGNNLSGELGTGTTTNSSVPAAVIGGASFATLSAAAGGQGVSHTCGVASNGDAYCWGNNADGALGNGQTSGPEVCDWGPCSTRPLAVVGGLNFAAVGAGADFTCALTTSGAAYCWGWNGLGELGSGSATPPQPAPVAVVGGLAFTALSTGGYFEEHTCGITTSGAAYCWGDNSYGQLGNGTTRGSSKPVAVEGGLSFAAVSAGGQSHTCGITTSGAAYCWGWNGFGQLGNGATTNSSIPVAVLGGLSFTTVRAAMAHTCGLTTSGAAYCWGANFDGELGDGSTTNSSTPVPVAGGLTFTMLTAGDFSTCGITSNGAAYCWGWNGYGQLGDGTTTSSPIPVKVLGQP
jgi:alpha-tubulin suppressor-like RCC1 family protein